MFQKLGGLQPDGERICYLTVTSVQGKIIAGKHVVVGKVRHSQRMIDPLVNIWVITESNGTILALQNVVVKCAKEF